ncbi:MAG TPA: TonB-dependent receptor [Marinospirillum sp.]|uniref:TonB-dependent receptor domain-containing protein n=1 Tax=Marinospirillum sp. TaxID=2183934 RepID=UPI002B48DED7|nr:TonB-dependent receptor [Marinospirillum sp.]HKM16476.1 TonB-dependent receptor [Marinospirillum sp.]
MAHLARRPAFLTTPLSTAIAVCLFAGSTSLYAKDAQEMDTLVVTAAGYEQKLTDAPASVTVITAAELRSRPYTNLLDAMRDVEGIDLGTGQDKSGQGTISMRGLGSDYTLVLIDGKRQNNNGDIYPNGFGGFQSAYLPPLDMIERIEVVRGPMSTLYGADAMGGVINIITKKVSDKWVGSITHSRTFQENSDLGNDTTTDFAVSGPLIKNLLGLTVRGSIYDKEESTPEYTATKDPSGNPYQPSTGFGGGGSTSDNTNYTSGFRLALTPDKQNEILFDYDISRQKYDNRLAQFGTLDSAETILARSRVGYEETQRTSRDQMSLTHIGKWDFGRSEVTLTHLETKNKGRSLPLSLEQRIAVRDLTGSEADNLAWIDNNLLPRPNRELASKGLTIDAKLELPLGDHFVVVGGQVIDQEMTDNVFGLLRTGYNNSSTQEHKQFSVFAEDNWAITKDFTFTGGMRYDDHSEFGGHISPRVYGVYNLTDAWTVKGGVSTGYKTPKTSDLYAGLTGFGGQGTSPWAGNPDLEPETSISGELAAYFTADEGHTFNATLFMTQFKDKIQNIDNCQDNPSGSKACANIDPRWMASTANGGFNSSINYKGNVSEAEIKGLELAGRYLLPFNLSLKANYTFTDTEVTKGPAKGRPLTGDPTSASASSADTPAKHMANLTLDWQANQDLNMYFGVYAEADRVRGWDADGKYLPDYEAYQVFHLGGSYNVSETLTISARVNNLLDRDFSDYEVDWKDNAGTWEATKLDDYKVIDKSRNFWISANMRF